MKKIFVFFIAAVILSAAILFFDVNFLNKDKFELIGFVTQTKSYCGGAAPSPNLLDELRNSEPIEGKAIYIKRGGINNLSSDYQKKLITDESGKFSIELAPGTYCLLEEGKLSLPSVESYLPSDLYELDLQCLREQWKICDKVIELSSDYSVDINYHENCFYNKKCTFCKDEFTPCPVPQ